MVNMITSFFISDVRSFKNDDSEKDQALAIQRDMNNQLQWCKDMDPTRSYLKFRLPYPQHISWLGMGNYNYTYCAGDLYYQAYVGNYSTELRLDASRADILKDQVYDVKQYDDGLYMWNEHVRLYSRFDKFGKTALSHGRCSCNDCCLVEKIANTVRDKSAFYEYVFTQMKHVYGKSKIDFRPPLLRKR